jgi:Cys-tRNA(Pro)/Cys-tRNA(Cys) deacylase
MDESTIVTRYLSEREIAFRFFRHPGPIYSLEQAAQERNQEPEQVVRSILFRVGAGEFIMVLIAGPAQVSWQTLRSYLGLSRLTMATKEEVLEVTGYETGAVSPIALPHPIRILVDLSVLDQDEISLGSGERGATIILKKEDLLRSLYNFETGDFSKKLG